MSRGTKPKGRESAIPGMEHLSPASSLEPETIWTPSCWPYAALHELVSAPERFAEPRDDLGQVHPFALHKGGGKALTAKIRYDVGDGGEPEDAQKGRLAELRENLGGWTADALDVVASACLGAGGRDAEVSTHTLLSGRGLKKKPTGGGNPGRGSYTRGQLDQARLALAQVASLHLRYREPRKAKDDLVIEEPAFVFWRVHRRGHGALDVYQVRLGPVLRHFLEDSIGVPGASSKQMSKQIVPLDTRILALDPQKERVTKRLARYAYYLTRMSIEDAGEVGAPPPQVSLKIRTLLEHVGLPLDPYNPKRTRESLERALETAVAEGEYRVGIVAAWRYEGEEPPVTGRWTKEWLDSKVLITPPEHVVERVREVASRRALHRERRFGVIDGGKNAPIPGNAPDEGATLGERLRAGRKSERLTQGHVAAELGVLQSTVSRIEAGKLYPDDGHQLKIEEWLAGHLERQPEARAEDSA